MSFEPQCPQCVFVSRELDQLTPCLLHVALAAPAEPEAAHAPVGDYDEPYVFGQLNPTVDRPGPFTLREYVRLRLLRSRVQEQRSIDPVRASWLWRPDEPRMRHKPRQRISSRTLR